MSDTPETDALMDVWRVGKLLSVSVMLDHARKLERERGWARTMLWELYWIAYDLSRSANAYAEGYNDSEDKKRIKLARTALKNFDKKIKKEGEKSRRHKNPET